MGLIAAKCTECGANIEVDQTKKAGVCPFCGCAYVTQDAIVNYNTTIINNNSITADNVNIVGGDFNNLFKLAKESWDCDDFMKRLSCFLKHWNSIQIMRNQYYIVDYQKVGNLKEMLVI